MSWVRVDDKFPRHPKVIGLCAQSAALWMAACCWCSEFETDGALPAAAVPHLSWYTPEGVEGLERAGLWRKTETGWQIHDYLKFNPSRRDKQEKRDREQARFLRSKRGQSAEVLPAETQQSARLPIPLPHPLLKEPPIVPQGTGGFVLSAESEKPAKRSRKDWPPPVVPDWLPLETWDAWLDYRKRGKGAYTTYAQHLTLKSLTAFRAQGHDPVAVLEQSIRRSWTDVFPVGGARQDAAPPRPTTNDADIRSRMRPVEEDPDA